MGAVFGNMRIGNTKSEDFGIVCRYPESQSMESRIEDLFKDEQEGDALVAGLKTLTEEEPDSVKESLVGSAEVQTKIQALELMHNGSKKVDTYIDVDDSLGFADKDICSVIGLGLSMEKEGKIGLKIGTSNEKLPEELTKEKTAVAFDLKVLKNGASTKKLDVPALITISKPDSIKTDDFQLYHMNAGEAEEVNYVEEDGLVTFAAEQFSTFVFVEDAEDTDSGSSGGGSTSSYGPGRWDTGTAGNKGPEDTKTQKPAGTWVQDEKGWWLKYEDGTWPASRWIEMTWNHVPSWYYFNAEGYMATGWMKDGDRWYYLDLTLLRSLSAKSRELNRLVYLDALTSIPNRHCLDGFLTDHISSSVLPTLGCCMLSISNLGMINTSLGRTAGDNALQDFSEILEKAGRSYGFVGRNNGNEFVLVTENASEEKMKQFLSSFEKEITSYNKSHTPIQFSSCYSLNQECCFTDP